MDEWELKFTPEAEEDLKNLDRGISQRIANRLVWLCSHFDEIYSQSLSNVWRDYFKFRVGDWRVVYQPEYQHKLIVIYRIERRDKVYKRF